MFVCSNFASSYVRQLRYSNPIEIMWNLEGHTSPCAYTDEYSMDFQSLSAHQALSCRRQLKLFHANLTTDEFGIVMKFPSGRSQMQKTLYCAAAETGRADSKNCAKVVTNQGNVRNWPILLAFRLLMGVDVGPKSVTIPICTLEVTLASVPDVLPCSDR